MIFSKKHICDRKVEFFYVHLFYTLMRYKFSLHFLTIEKTIESFLARIRSLNKETETCTGPSVGSMEMQARTQRVERSLRSMISDGDLRSCKVSPAFTATKV